MRSYTSNPEGTEPMGNPLAGVSFTLDGEEFTCEGQPDLLDMSELALLAAQATDIRRPEAQASIAAFLQMAFGPREYARFRMHTRSNRTQPEVILQIMAGINEELEGFLVASTGRPTVQPSPSLPGDAERAAQLQRAISLGTGEVTILAPGGTGTGGSSGTRRKAPSARSGGSGNAGSSKPRAGSSKAG